MNSLASGLVESGFEVTAIAAQPTYFKGAGVVPSVIAYDGVRIERAKSTRFGRRSLVLRAIDGATFAMSSALRLAKTPKGVIVLSVTNPPFLPVVAAVRRRFGRGPFVLLVHDVYPEAAVALGTIRRGGIWERIWASVDQFTLTQADRIIVLGEEMRRLISIKLRNHDHSKLAVIQNWADGELIAPIAKRDTITANIYGLVDAFVVQYSGNVGLSQGLDVVLDAAARLRDGNVVFAIVGEGVALERLKTAAVSRGLSNVRFLPRAPMELLADSLSACDVGLVTLARGMEGISVPSKYYAVLASGRPVVAAMSDQAEVAQSIVTNHCGVVVQPGDAAALANAILDLRDDRTSVSAMGQSARNAFDQLYSRPHALTAYARLLEDLERHSLDASVRKLASLETTRQHSGRRER